MKYTGFFGLLTTIIFLIGFGILFLINPQIIEELQFISIANLNITGVNGYRWAAIVCYLLLGIVQSTFAIRLFKMFRKTSSIYIGAILIILIGLFWITLGIIPVRLNGEIISLYAIISDTSIQFIIPFAFILLAIDLEKVIKSKFIKYLTLAIGCLQLVFLGIHYFSLDIEFGLQPNINILLYFLWFSIAGIRIIKNAST